MTETKPIKIKPVFEGDSDNLLLIDSNSLEGKIKYRAESSDITFFSMNDVNTRADDLEPQEWLTGMSPTRTPVTSHGCLKVAAAALITLAIVVFLTSRAAADSSTASNPWLCDTSNTTALGTVAAWDTNHYGWVDMPADLQPFADPLYADSDLASAYMLYFSTSKQEVWIIPIADLNDVSADANGDHEGQHNLCDVHIYPLPGDTP